jgi:hypothetical protein
MFTKYYEGMIMKLASFIALGSVTFFASCGSKSQDKQTTMDSSQKAKEYETIKEGTLTYGVDLHKEIRGTTWELKKSSNSKDAKKTILTFEKDKSVLKIENSNGGDFDYCKIKTGGEYIIQTTDKSDEFSIVDSNESCAGILGIKKRFPFAVIKIDSDNSLTLNRNVYTKFHATENLMGIESEYTQYETYTKK